MADKNLLSQMLESLVNDEQQKAEELFHEYVVSKSREIYESLIESEMGEDETEDEEVEEGMEVTFTETDDEDDTVDFGGDATDDLEGDMDAGADFGDEEGAEDEFGGEAGEAGEEELFQDLADIVDQLQAKFDEIKGHESEEDEMGSEEGDDEAGEGNPFGGEDEDETEEDANLETVREYVEKVAGGHGAEKKGAAEGSYSGTGSQSDKISVNAKSVVAGKNDMGGTAANILGGKEEAGVLANQGQLKGNGLLKGTPKDMSTGNINVPGGKAGSAFTKKEPGHGAEKKGEGEGKYSGTGSQSASASVNTQSLFRGRR